MNPDPSAVKQLVDRARACRECEAALPLGPRPILQLDAAARILIASQAPGRIAHQSGVPFRDPSGRRLRQWTGLDETAFYDARNVAIVPMGLCYPGRGPGGDLPPRLECAPLWRRALLEPLCSVRLTLVIGRHAQRWHLHGAGSVADQARGWLAHGGSVVPLPHPSPRNNGWLQRHPWFESELVPRLQRAVRSAIATN